MISGPLCLACAGALLGDTANGATELRQALTAYTHEQYNLWVPFFRGQLAAIEAEREGLEGALARVGEALALAQQTGEHWTDAFLHRICGEILLKRDPANAAPAEEALLTAIAIAQQQKAKSFELQAAHTLAKLYRSTGRAADAHAVLAPALEGFSPTPEFPEIEEAQTLLAALADTDEVKNAAAARQRRLKLQMSLGQAMMWSKGYGAEETKIAFERLQDLGGAIGNFGERSAANYGYWAHSHMRGDFKLARETAESFVRRAPGCTYVRLTVGPCGG
jgi:hypothetical protein